MTGIEKLRILVPVLLGLGLTAPSAALPPATGFQPEVHVANATRLDWQFVVAGLPADDVKLPSDYDSSQQRYQLYVPPTYARERLWPLIVFISPGDEPLGWRYWQKPCEDGSLLFCAAYGAGNNCPAGQRTRIVLDMLDDVRRKYRVDPEQTYLAGFSGGGRLACRIAFALPEYCGGVLAVCGSEELNPLDYLRHRVRDRLSVALLTGTNDFKRRETEDYRLPLLQALDVRSRLWVGPGLGHAIPAADTLAEAHAWLAEDLPRRQANARDRATLAAAPEEVPTPLRQATRTLEAAQADLLRPDRTWRGVALLQGVVARWGKMEPAVKARKLLEEIQADPRRARALAEQRGEEERQQLTAQARALERFGEPRGALKAWEALAKHYPDIPEGREALTEARRLSATVAATPYLGLAFAGETTSVAEVLPGGPADRAGLRAGDVLVRLAAAKLTSLQDVRSALQPHKPGQSVKLEVQRAGKPVALTLELGALPVTDEE